MKSHKDLEVWKKSIELVTGIYEITKSFPKEERYSLTDQIRRSSRSVYLNSQKSENRRQKSETFN